ncbi:DUF2953 domain-containing protein [Cohnella mopanensis]|uniref:DUF2953 domain-containing protein n=1 Tax=Cohnella mopanensis TaxID=2911966 RepID=UPI001EF9B482|nr:DUF2953 domain-containing protein [Cohnella mopanensis]
MAFWLWIVLAIVIAGLVAALFSRIRVRVRYSRSGRLDQLVVVIQALYGLFHYQVNLPSIVIRGWNVVYKEHREGNILGPKRNNKKRIIGRLTIVRYMKAYRTILLSTTKFRRWARQTMKKIECTRWRLDFRVGTGDAASTATMTGLLWAVSGCASGAAAQLISLKTSPQGDIAPNYSSTEFTVVWEADFRIRLSAALWAVVKLGTSTIRIGKAIRAWRNWLSGPPESVS